MIRRNWIAVTSLTIGLLLAVVMTFYLSAAALAAPSGAATTKSLSTNFIIQNFSSTQPVTVAVQYLRAKNDGGGAWVASPANSSFSLSPAQSTTIAQYFDSVMPSGRGSATISSTGPVGAVVNQLARGQAATSGAYTGFDTGAAQFYAPLVFRNLSTSAGIINSTLTVMNVGTAATDFRVIYISGVTFTPVATTTVSNLAVGETYVVDQSEDNNLTDGYYGSAVIEAITGSGTIAVVGNQFVGANSLLTYNGFRASDAYTSWSIPFYMCRLANGFSAILNIQNVSGSNIPAGGISVSFAPDSSLAAPSFVITNTSDVPNNATFQINPRVDTRCPAESFGGAQVTATGNVVVMVNQLQAGAGAALSYNGIRQDGTKTALYTPAVFSRLSNGFSTVLRIQNLTGTASQAYINYYPSPTCSGCQTYQFIAALGANASIQQNHRQGEGVSTHPLPAGWFGSAVITSTVPIGGIVNELDLDVLSEDGSLSFNMFAP